MKLPLMVLVLLASGSLAAQDVFERRFHANGTVSEEFVQHSDHVAYRRFHANGQVRELGRFVGGCPEGTWKQFNEQGERVALVQFTDGIGDGDCAFVSFEGLTGDRHEFAQGRATDGDRLDGNSALAAERERR